jgi:plasmid stabilization system protein ParE
MQPGSGREAHDRLRSIRTALRDLGNHPSRLPLGQHAGVRERFVAGYRLMYIVDPDTGSDHTAGNVTVLRIYGPGQSRDRL